MKTWLLSHWRTMPFIFLGAAIYSFGLTYFIIPNELTEGGVTGIGILLNYVANVPLSWSILLLNIPLFIISWRILGKQQVGHALFGTIAISLCLWVMEKFIAIGWIKPFYTSSDYILAALYAGVTLGTGLGIVFRAGGNTGGVDLIARMMYKLRGYSMGQVILVVDAIILGGSLAYLSIEKVLYTLVCVFVASRVIDFIQEGAYAARAFQIFTWKSDEMARAITTQLERGVTLFHGQGVYSGQTMNVVYCVVSRQEMRKLQTLVRTIDKQAFIVVTNVHDVLGEGFKLD